VGIDLETSEGRKEYLTEKLDDLLGGINDSYGMVLMKELLDRLELTIKDFNDEVKVLCSQLVKKQEERQHLMEMLINDGIKDLKPSNDKQNIDADPISNNDDDEKKSDVPAWERKLSKLEKNK
tara:strand:+ start:373 stop:741 length:369 start_codon:yes stop_codon:yes gene_type:complete